MSLSWLDDEDAAAVEKTRVLRPLKAIRAKCLDCCCGSVKEVRLCPSRSCFLWPYRMGTRPTSKVAQAANEAAQMAEAER